MGNREQLLEAARACLAERGFDGTTVRDIAARAGVNHAAIGYHFGSREALLTQVLLAAVDELADELAPESGEPPSWDALLATADSHRDLWIAQLEAVLRAARDPAVRAQLVPGQQAARDGMGGAVPLAVLVGLVVQSLLEPNIVRLGAEIEEVLGHRA